jgi:hypothetical protein
MDEISDKPKNTTAVLLAGCGVFCCLLAAAVLLKV